MLTVSMERYLTDLVRHDCLQKVILLSGPRQSGKTTLAKRLFPVFDYFNYDSPKDRLTIMDMQWKRDVEAVIFDEIHKMTEWKRWIKGIYDTEGNQPHLIVTGSANLEVFRKAGDSLAGRYFRFRLHPIDLKEACLYWKNNPQEALERLISVGGFPEPFLNGKSSFYRRWKKSHVDIMIRQDILDLHSVHSIQAIETLLLLLESRVATTISYKNLANDLQVNDKSIKTWLEILENIYAVFRVTPYHENIARALLKEPKFYFYDIPRVQDSGARLENLVACALLKEINFIEDTLGFTMKLHYLRTKDGCEVDFLITCDTKPALCIEVKTSDNSPSKHFNVFRKHIGNVPCVQLVLHLNREFDTQDGIQVRDLTQYLSQIDLRNICAQVNNSR